MNTNPEPNEHPPVAGDSSGETPNSPLEGVIQDSPAPPPVKANASVPEDLRVPWDGLDVVLLLFFGLGSALILAQMLRFVFAVFFAFTPDQARNAATVNTAFAVTHQVAFSLALLAFIWVQMRLRFRAPFWETLRFRSVRLGELSTRATYLGLLMGGALTAIFVNVVSALLRTPAKLPIEQLFQNRSSILMVMAAGIVVAPLVEEVMFRGFLYPVLARRLGKVAGIAITGILFGLMHAAQLWGGWAQIALLVTVGVFFTYVRAQTGSVLASYLLHLGYNGFLLLGFYLATGGLKNLPPPR